MDDSESKDFFEFLGELTNEEFTKLIAFIKEKLNKHTL